MARRTRIAVTGALVVAFGSATAWSEEGADRTCALEERVRQLEEENRRLREQVEGRSPVATDEMLPAEAWQIQLDPREHSHEPAWPEPAAPPGDAGRPLRDQFYVKEIVSDAGC